MPSPSTGSSVAAPAAAMGVGEKSKSYLGAVGGFLAGCARDCAASPLGRLVNGAFKPIEMATGGVVPAPLCGSGDPAHKKSAGTGGVGVPGGSASQAGPPGPQQAAAAIKKDQAEAEARGEAVRYLSTIPCHYYPEAEAALIQALRTDRSECVRWEAARALAQGCCCTKKTIEALKLAVSGSVKDGNPAERSARVRAEAICALERCIAMSGDTFPTPRRPESPVDVPHPLPQPTRPESPLETGNAPLQSGGPRQAAYYAEIEKQPTENLLAEARRLVESSKLTASPSGRAPQGRSLLELWRRSERPSGANEDVP